MGNEHLYTKLNSFWKMLDDMAENNEGVRMANNKFVDRNTNNLLVNNSSKDSAK